MKKLVITADDFGFTKSVNDGIAESVKNGIITDIAMMVLTDKEDQDHALHLIEKYNLQHIGLHTSLFPWGKHNRPQRHDFVSFFQDATDAEIREKAVSEIQAFEALLGTKPEFISPQFNMHGNLRLLKVLAEYSVENNIPMRIPRAVLTHDEIEDSNYAAEVYLKRLGVKMSDHLFAHILGSSANSIINEFMQELSAVKDNETTEILFHPGYFDPDILEGSSLNYERARDLAIATNREFKKKIEDLGFQLSHMEDL